MLVLRLSEEITFRDAPLEQNVTVDTDALVKCVVDGQPEPKVSWRFAGSRINFSESYLFMLLCLLELLVMANSKRWWCRIQIFLSWLNYSYKPVKRLSVCVCVSVCMLTRMVQIIAAAH